MAYSVCTITALCNTKEISTVASACPALLGITIPTADLNLDSALAIAIFQEFATTANLSLATSPKITVSQIIAPSSTLQLAGVPVALQDTLWLFIGASGSSLTAQPMPLTVLAPYAQTDTPTLMEFVRDFRSPTVSIHLLPLAIAACTGTTGTMDILLLRLVLPIPSIVLISILWATVSPAALAPTS